MLTLYQSTPVHYVHFREKCGESDHFWAVGFGSKSRTPSEHPNPHYNRLKWVVHLPRNGTSGFDPQPFLAYGTSQFSLCLLGGGDCGAAQGHGARPALRAHPPLWLLILLNRTTRDTRDPGGVGWGGGGGGGGVGWGGAVSELPFWS